MFARPPLPGRAKTRLSPALPAAMASELYAAMLADTLAAVRATPADSRSVFWADVPDDASRSPEGFYWHAQRGVDLGERLSDAFDTLLAEPGIALIVGSDCPALSPALLASALDALTTHDGVLGPASDGGYWAVGLSKRAPELFTEVPWSTPEVFALTRERAHGLGLSVATLSELRDVDRPADLAELIAAAAVSNASACGPHVRAALQGMRLLPT